MKRLATLLSVAIALGTAACADPAPDAPRLTVANGTDIPIGVYVDDEWVGTDEPGATIQVALGPTADPSYRIEARSPSGAVLASFDAGRAATEAAGQGGAALGTQVAVPCGLITILVGELGAGESLAPAMAVEPGPCP